MKTILIVEDDKLLGKAISNALTKAGFEVFWAKNGKEAFEVMGVQSMNFVYLDIMLPGDMDGYAILKKLRSESATASIPVVILSNLGQMMEIDRAMELGATDYVVKANIDLKNLVELTRSKLGS